MVELEPNTVILESGTGADHSIDIIGKHPGHLEITAIINPENGIR